MRQKRSFLMALTVAAFLGTLFFGLRPKGFGFVNNVHWLANRPGLHFSKDSIAYAKLGKIQEDEKWHRERGFSIEIAIEPEILTRDRFRVILSLHGGKDSEQMVIGQWGSYIIVMHGDDYINQKQMRRLERKVVVPALKPILISLTVGGSSKKLYVDGQLVSSLAGSILLPEGDSLLLTLGNSVYGNRSWQGNILGVSLYAQELSGETIRSHLTRLVTTKTSPSVEDDKLMLNYLFSEKGGGMTVNSAGQNYPLLIPTWMHLFSKTILSSPIADFAANEGFLSDSVINVIGFMPLGFCLCACFITLGKRKRGQAILLVTALCFTLSLGIEITQAWIPSRSSQLLDVLLNTLGALIGAKGKQVVEGGL